MNSFPATYQWKRANSAADSARSGLREISLQFRRKIKNPKYFRPRMIYCQKGFNIGASLNSAVQTFCGNYH
jgi:hypothetical protein